MSEQRLEMPPETMIRLLGQEVERLKKIVNAADDMRDAIRKAGVKRLPEMYQAVMYFDSVRGFCEKDDND